MSFSLNLIVLIGQFNRHLVGLSSVNLCFTKQRDIVYVQGASFSVKQKKVAWVGFHFSYYFVAIQVVWNTQKDFPGLHFTQIEGLLVKITSMRQSGRIWVVALNFRGLNLNYESHCGHFCRVVPCDTQRKCKFLDLSICLRLKSEPVVVVGCLVLDSGCRDNRDRLESGSYNLVVPSVDTVFANIVAETRAETFSWVSSCVTFLIKLLVARKLDPLSCLPHLLHVAVNLHQKGKGTFSFEL